ncbi:MAG TPA: right-handed parallel beta-helix repeat-containing protein, partial [Polyangiaceae bacterium]
MRVGSRWTWGLVLVAASTACGSSSDGGAPGPSTSDCPDGETLDPATNSCVAGCKDDERADGATCTKLGWQNCPTGFVADPSGYGCVDVTPADDCPAGTMPTIGSTDCKPVGTTSCAAGFVADASGWGCTAVAPAASCTGATMETLGSTSCVPVGDCAAAFPPSAATLFVSPSATVDATHFQTIGAALAAATDGTTIAIDTGTYAESLVLAHAVHLVGKCAAQVSITQAAPTDAGVAVLSAVAPTVSGVTISSHLPGVSVGKGGSLALTNVVVDGNTGGGVAVIDTGSKVTIDGSVVRGTKPTTTGAVGGGHGIDLGTGTTTTITKSAVVGNLELGIYAKGAGTTLAITSSIVADTLTNVANDLGVGVDIAPGAQGDVTASFVARNHEAGLTTSSTAKLHVAQSVVAGNVPSAAGYGRGFTADGGELTIEESTIVANADLGISAESKSVVTVENSVIRATVPNTDRAKGAGVAASSGGQATLGHVALVGNSEEGAFADGTGSTVTLNDSIARDGVMLSSQTAGNGAVAQNGGHLVLNGSALVANHESGLLLFDPGSAAEVTQSIIARQLTSQKNQYGRGIVLQNGPALTLVPSVVAANSDIGIAARGDATTLTMKQSIVRDTVPEPLDKAHGRGLNVIEGAVATVTDCELLRNAEVAALVSGPGAKLTVATTNVASTQLDARTSSAGRGIVAQMNGAGIVSGSAIVDSFQAGVSSAGEGGFLAVDHSLVDGTKLTPNGGFGHGALAFDGGVLTLDHVTIRKSAAVGVLVGGGSATLSACKVLDNAVGINVQDGSTL